MTITEQVWRLFDEGLDDEEIAEELSLRPARVRYELHSRGARRATREEPMAKSTADRYAEVYPDPERQAWIRRQFGVGP